MGLKPGYKQTEAGVIPEEWEVVPVSSLLASPIQNGVFNEPSRKGRGCKLINVIDLYGRFPIDTNELERFDANKDELYRFGVRHGDIFFTRSSLTPDGIAQCNVYGGVQNEDVVFDCHIIRVRPNSVKVEPFYLARYCGTRPARRYLVANSKTTTMTTIDQAVIANLPVSLPSLSEQRAIAGALGEVDALLGALEKLIAKKRDLKQAATQQLLTGQKRLPGFGKKGLSNKRSEVGVIPEDWPVAKIKEHAANKTGKRNTQDRVADGQYPFFVRSQVVERINSYSFDGEAVLTAGDGVGTGKVFHYISGRFDFHQRVYRISNFSPDLNGFFFFLVFSARFYDRIMSMTAKSSVDSVRLEMIADMQIPLPPLHEQTAIAEVLSDMDAEIAALEQRLAKTRALKQGMMQELLTGKTRLV